MAASSISPNASSDLLKHVKERKEIKEAKEKRKESDVHLDVIKRRIT